ncbi:DUF2971 domain-containing protein [Shewanella morhuae]|nr:DUF2971 domain-containing protein [Shewanella morhuae]
MTSIESKKDTVYALIAMCYNRTTNKGRIAFRTRSCGRNLVIIRTGVTLMILQRYMDLPKFVSLLQTKSIYLAKMAAFDDALEGGLTVSDFFKVSNAPKTFDFAFNLAWPSYNESQDEREERSTAAHKAQNELRERKFETLFGVYQCDEAEQLFPICKQWLYVSCWHQSPHECSAMWKIYGSDKNSVCIFTTVEKLKASIATSNLFKNIDFREVNYISHIDHEFSIDPISPFIAKSKPYTFENEFRVVAWNENIDLTMSSVNSEVGALLGVKLETLIDKIVVSPYSDPWFKNSVKQLCNELGVSVDVIDSEIRMEPIKGFYDALSHLDKLV